MQADQERPNQEVETQSPATLRGIFKKSSANYDNDTVRLLYKRTEKVYSLELDCIREDARAVGECADNEGEGLNPTQTCRG